MYEARWSICVQVTLVRLGIAAKVARTELKVPRAELEKAHPELEVAQTEAEVAQAEAEEQEGAEEPEEETPWEAPEQAPTALVGQGRVCFLHPSCMSTPWHRQTPSQQDRDFGRRRHSHPWRCNHHSISESQHGIARPGNSGSSPCIWCGRPQDQADRRSHVGNLREQVSRRLGWEKGRDDENFRGEAWVLARNCPNHRHQVGREAVSFRGDALVLA